jgi:hypothetical protein
MRSGAAQVARQEGAPHHVHPTIAARHRKPRQGGEGVAQDRFRRREVGAVEAQVQDRQEAREDAFEARRLQPSAQDGFRVRVGGRRQVDQRHADIRVHEDEGHHHRLAELAAEVAVLQAQPAGRQRQHHGRSVPAAAAAFRPVAATPCRGAVRPVERALLAHFVTNLAPVCHVRLPAGGKSFPSGRGIRHPRAPRSNRSAIAGA